MITDVALYGIPNCATVKKARQWLDEHHIEYRFHDFKRQGVPAALSDWMAQAGWESLLNRRGTTWRNLPDSQKSSIIDAASALKLMQEQPSVIKRPVMLAMASDAHVLRVGFDADDWQTFFLSTTSPRHD